MGFYQVIGFVIVLYIVQIDASMPPFNMATTTRTNATTRMLRKQNTITGDKTEDRAGVSMFFREKVKTMFSFSKPTPEKLRDWLAKEKSVDTVFTRLHLFKAGKYLFYEPEFVTWVKYADDLSIKNPKNRLAAISTLTAQYGDDTLYQMLELATYSSSMK
ncbi:Avirulence (Avh) protein, partial [Phytophthora megakarya]